MLKLKNLFAESTINKGKTEKDFSIWRKNSCVLLIMTYLGFVWDPFILLKLKNLFAESIIDKCRS